jgi:hypothetical protein
VFRIGLNEEVVRELNLEDFYRVIGFREIGGY